jgi:hypothetical protein
MIDNLIVQEVIEYLDTMEREVTKWEAGFLESLKRQTFPMRPKQFACLVKMAEDYCDPLLAAELRGQLRLFA